MTVPVGPHPISPKRQISLPAAVMKQVNLEPGDQVWFEVRDDAPRCILLMPAEYVARRWAARSMAQSAPELLDGASVAAEDQGGFSDEGS